MSPKKISIQKALKNKHKLLDEYKNAIDVSAAVTKTNPQGMITYANDAFCEMSGFAREELINHSHSIIKEPNAENSFFQDMWETISRKKVWKGCIKNSKKNGETYYVRSSIVPILDEHEQIVEYIAFSHDITDILKQEEVLKKRIDEEVKKNLQLHKAREEENLREAKFSTIGRMAAGITHEINTPLTYAKGNLEMMIQDILKLDDAIQQKEYLIQDSRTVLEGLNRIAGIVESMREMASHTEENPMFHNLYSSLITALTLASNKAKHICEIRIQNETFKLGMDKNKLHYFTMVQRQRIEQVFVIIINNALDSLVHISDFHARLLEITIDNEYDFVVIRFKDNGGGIDEEILPKIFDPFESNKKEGGMGIGLNVAKRIISDHNGKIIPSNHENGALFELYIPRIHADIV
jgi:PAS domain S-box-containing protein